MAKINRKGTRHYKKIQKPDEKIHHLFKKKKKFLKVSPLNCKILYFLLF
jgi:hypothetical protein